MAFAVAATPAVVLVLRASTASPNTPFQPSLARTGARLSVRASASMRERAAAGGTAAAMAAMLALPDAADAAPGLSPTLKNFLLSIVAGGVVLVALAGAVIAVANFDPVRRG